MLVIDVDGDAHPDVIAQSNSGADVALARGDERGGHVRGATPIGRLPASSHGPACRATASPQLEAGGRPEIAVSSGGGIYYFRDPRCDPEAGGWPSVRVHVGPLRRGLRRRRTSTATRISTSPRAPATSKRVEWYRNPGDGAADWQAFPLGDVSTSSIPTASSSRT